MGGSPSVPASPDPEKIAAQARAKSVALSQLYMEKMSAMGMGSTVLAGKPDTVLTDYGPEQAQGASTISAASTSSATGTGAKTYPPFSFGGSNGLSGNPIKTPTASGTRTFGFGRGNGTLGAGFSFNIGEKTDPLAKIYGKEGAKEVQAAFNDYNRLMEYRAKKRAGTL